jgi:5-methylcytosine-specific restriction endonuclease McrA
MNIHLLLAMASAFTVILLVSLYSFKKIKKSSNISSGRRATPLNKHQNNHPFDQPSNVTENGYFTSKGYEYYESAKALYKMNNLIDALTQIQKAIAHDYKTDYLILMCKIEHKANNLSDAYFTLDKIYANRENDLNKYLTINTDDIDFNLIIEEHKKWIVKSNINRNDTNKNKSKLTISSNQNINIDIERTTFKPTPNKTDSSLTNSEIPLAFHTILKDFISRHYNISNISTKRSKPTYGEQLSSQEWQRKRLSIIEIDKWKCQRCQQYGGISAKDDEKNWIVKINNEIKLMPHARRRLHVHHTYYTIGANAWEYDNSALITLCSECHTNEHETVTIPILNDQGIPLEELNLCPKCNGSGVIDEYHYHKDGICFTCGGEQFVPNDHWSLKR